MGNSRKRERTFENNSNTRSEGRLLVPPEQGNCAGDLWTIFYDHRVPASVRWEEELFLEGKGGKWELGNRKEGCGLLKFSTRVDLTRRGGGGWEWASLKKRPVRSKSRAPLKWSYEIILPLKGIIVSLCVRRFKKGLTKGGSSSERLFGGTSLCCL